MNIKKLLDHIIIVIYANFITCNSVFVFFSIFNGFLYCNILCNDQIANSRRSLKHDEVVIARQAVEEGRGLVVVVNKMDLLRGKQLYDKVMEAVPQEIQTIMPQVCLCTIFLK